MQALGWVSSPREWMRSVVLGVVAIGWSLPAFAGVQPTTTTLAVTSSSSTVTTVSFATTVKLTATVAASGSPVHPGIVKFCDVSINTSCTDAALLGTAQLLSSGSPGTASISIRLGVGTHSLKAIFAGISDYQTSTSTAQPLTVTATSLFPSISTLSYYGTAGSYVLQGFVQGRGGRAAPPSGNVQFFDTTTSANLTSGASLNATSPVYTFGLSNPATPATGGFPIGTAVADLNGDGIPDVVVANQNDDTVSVLLGVGDGTFQPQVTYNVGDSPTGMAVGDFNSDGKVDVVVTNVDDDTISVLLGNGDGTLQAQQPYATGSSPTWVEVADLNHDGILDLAMTNIGDSDVSIRLGVGDGTFQTQTTFSTGSGPSAAASADFDSDGNLDLVTVNVTARTISFLKGNGDGTFQTAVNYVVGSGANGIAIADFNGDHLLDVAVANYNDDTISVLLGNGNGTFQTQFTLDGPSSAGPLVAGDFNGDGKADIAAVGYDDHTVSVLLGNGDGTFQPRKNTPVGSGPSWIALADLNGDGLPDFVVANLDDTTLSSLLNNSGWLVSGINSASVTPGDLVKAVYAGDSIYVASSSAAVALGNNQLATTLALVPSGNPIVGGDPVTFTATLSPYSIGVQSTNGASVMFYDGVSLLGPGTLSGGVATYTASALADGTHSITASYEGNSYFSPATSSTLTEFVHSPTTTTLAMLNGATAATTAPLGTVITLKASVVSEGSPVTAGTVKFCDNSINNYCTDSALLGTMQLTASGTASIKVRLPLGSRSLSATFVPTGALSTSSSTPQTFAVSGISPTITSLVDYGSNGSYYLNSSVVGLPFGGALPGPTGSVSFLDTSNSNAVLATVPLASGTSSVGPLYTAQRAVGTGSAPVSTVFADLNNDGYPDAIVANAVDDTVSVLLGNGDGTFHSQVTYPTGTDPMAVVSGDFNGDGKVDLATTSGITGEVSILLGNGDGTLQTNQDFPAGDGPAFLAVGDFNLDGKLDIAAVDDSSPTPELILLLGNGDGTLQSPQLIDLPNLTTSIFTADLNGDGYPDIGVANFGDDEIDLYFGKGDGTFQPLQAVPSNRVFSVTVGDFNGDGKLDLAAARTVNRRLSIYFGNGNGTFQSGSSYNTGVEAAFPVAADVDGDGKTDLVLMDSSNRALVMLNSGTGTFPTRQTFALGDQPRSVAVADLNGDGHLDLVSPDSQNDELDILLYTSGTLVTLPSTPVTVDSNPHVVIARYTGDANYATSDSHPPVDLTLANYFADTLTISENKVFLSASDSVTFTATLSPNSFNGNSTDGEPILFFDGVSILGVGTPLSGGISTLTVSASVLGAGSHPVSASYSGDTYLQPNNSPSVIAYVVLPTTTSLAITNLGGTPLTTAPPNTPITLTATLAQGTSSVTQGIVTFCDTSINVACTGAAILGTAEMTTDSTANLSVTLPIGPHSLKAILAQNQIYGTSTSATVPFTVTGHNGTVIEIGSTGTAGNYTLTGTLRANTIASLLPTGTISFQDVTSSNATIATGNLSSASLSALLNLQAGGTPATGFAPLFMTQADFNGDGILDLATSDYLAGKVTVLLGAGDGTFGSPHTFSVQGSPVGIVAGDFDGDGVPDLATASQDDGTFGVLLGNGDGTFQPLLPYSGGFALEGLISGDFNQDGFLDLAATDTANNQVLVLLGNGDGTFQDPALGYDVGAAPLGLAAADLNGDGLPDLVVANTNDNFVSVLLGNADGTFQAQTSVATSDPIVGVALADLNGDGKLDLATTIFNSSSGSVQVRLGNGDGTFQSPQSYSADALFTILAVDVDGDGKLDLTMSGVENAQVSVLLGNGDGTFQPERTFLTGGAGVGMVAGDFNSDGRIDLALATNNTATLSVLINSSTLVQTVSATGVTVPGVGTHQVVANYPGDTYFTSSVSSAIPLTASQFTTSLALASSSNPGALGTSITLTATLVPASGGGASTTGETITFKDGSTTLGTGTLDSSGKATLAISTLTLGSHSLTASYLGDANFLGSTSSPLTQTVQYPASIWIANSGGTLSRFDSSGTPNPSAVTGGGTGVAFDSTGNIWSINPPGGGLAEFNASGTAIHSNLTGGGLSHGTALAIDGIGQVWIVNRFENRIAVFDSSGAAVTSSTGYTGGFINAPNTVAIDSSGNVWMTNINNNSITEVIGAAAPVVTPASTAVQNQQLGVKP